jgi:hypothetical protein
MSRRGWCSAPVDCSSRGGRLDHIWRDYGNFQEANASQAKLSRHVWLANSRKNSGSRSWSARFLRALRTRIRRKQFELISTAAHCGKTNPKLSDVPISSGLTGRSSGISSSHRRMPGCWNVYRRMWDSGATNSTRVLACGLRWRPKASDGTPCRRVRMPYFGLP